MREYFVCGAGVRVLGEEHAVGMSKLLFHPPMTMIFVDNDYGRYMPCVCINMWTRKKYNAQRMYTWFQYNSVFRLFFWCCCSHNSLTYVHTYMSQQYYPIYSLPCMFLCTFFMYVYLVWQYIIYSSLFRMSNFISYRNIGWMDDFDGNRRGMEKRMKEVYRLCVPVVYHHRHTGENIAHTKICTYSTAV